MRYFLLLVLFVSLSAKGQIDRFNQWSVEASAGVHVPLGPTDGISRSKYIGFKQFQLSARYMFNEKYGLKGHYANNRFQPRGESDLGIGYHRVGVEGVLNVGRVLNVSPRIRERVALLAHLGGGITFAYPESTDSAEHIGNIMVGFTGLVKLSPRMALSGDITLVNSVLQHYGYDGAQLDPGFEGDSGSFVNVSAGIVFYLGMQELHSDWY